MRGLRVPRTFADGSLLAAKAKGIHKPKDLPYALSVLINLGSPAPTECRARA